MARRKKNKKWISWIVLILLAVAAGVVCYFVYKSYFKDSEGKEPESQSQVTSQKEEISETVNSVEETSAPVEKKEVEQYDGENPNEKEGLTGVMTYVGVSNNTLRVRVNIDQYLSSGECKIEIKSGEKTIFTQSGVGVEGSAATSTCAGFDIPTTKLGDVTGKVKIIVTISAGDRNGSIIKEASL